MSPPTPERLGWWRRWRVVPLLLRPDGVWDGSLLWPGFERWCAAHPGRRCTLWLAAPLLHELVCDPALPLADDRAALEWARPLLLHYHGEAAADWALAAWQQDGQRGVSVLHGTSLQALQDLALASGVRLQAVRPWWSLVLGLALRRHPAMRVAAAARLVVLEGERIVVADLHLGRVTGLQVRRLDDASPASLQRWVRDHGERPDTWVLGYGLLGSAPPGLQAPEPLDDPLPAPQWLGLRTRAAGLHAAPAFPAGIGAARS